MVMSSALWKKPAPARSIPPPFPLSRLRMTRVPLILPILPLGLPGRKTPILTLPILPHGQLPVVIWSVLPKRILPQKAYLLFTHRRRSPVKARLSILPKQRLPRGRLHRPLLQPEMIRCFLLVYNNCDRKWGHTDRCVPIFIGCEGSLFMLY